MAAVPYFILSPSTVLSLVGLFKRPDKTVPTPAEDWRQAHGRCCHSGVERGGLHRSHACLGREADAQATPSHPGGRWQHGQDRRPRGRVSCLWHAAWWSLNRSDAHTFVLRTGTTESHDTDRHMRLPCRNDRQLLWRVEWMQNCSRTVISPVWIMEANSDTTRILRLMPCGLQGVRRVEGDTIA